MNLKNNTPRMHHITPFWGEKFINFLGRGTAPPQTHLLRRLRRLDSRVFGARPATPNVPVALTPMVDVRGVTCYLDSTELSSNKYSEHIQFSKFSSATSGLSRRESSSHCWHLRDETGQFCRVGSGNVNWALQKCCDVSEVIFAWRQDGRNHRVVQ